MWQVYRNRILQLNKKIILMANCCLNVRPNLMSLMMIVCMTSVLNAVNFLVQLINKSIDIYFEI